jgi:hypothetical protein
MLNEQAPKVAFADPKALCQFLDAASAAVKSALANERKRPRNRVRSSAP